MFAVDGISSDIDGGRLAATDAINRLLSAQIMLLNNRRLQAAMRSSRLPAVKTLVSFHFSFQPSIKREQIESLHELGFIEWEHITSSLLGSTGVWATHTRPSALRSLRHRAGRMGVINGTLVDLITSLEQAEAAGHLSRELSVLTHP